MCCLTKKTSSRLFLPLQAKHFLPQIICFVCDVCTLPQSWLLTAHFFPVLTVYQFSKKKRKEKEQSWQLPKAKVCIDDIINVSWSILFIYKDLQWAMCLYMIFLVEKLVEGEVLSGRDEEVSVFSVCLPSLLSTALVRDGCQKHLSRHLFRSDDVRDQARVSEEPKGGESSWWRPNTRYKVGEVRRRTGKWKSLVEMAYHTLCHNSVFSPFIISNGWRHWNLPQPASFGDIVGDVVLWRLFLHFSQGVSTRITELQSA